MKEQKLKNSSAMERTVLPGLSYYTVLIANQVREFCYSYVISCFTKYMYSRNDMIGEKEST